MVNINTSKSRRKPRARKIHPKATGLLKSALIPNPRNDYRPHLVRRYGMLVLIILTVMLQCSYWAVQNYQILGDRSNINSTELLSYTNTAREDNGLSSLKTNQKLSAAATDKAQDMIDKGYWSHTSPDGTTPWDWLDKTGYSYVTAGENLARGFNNSNAIIQAWLGSPSHRANVLNTDYTEVGFAEAYGNINNRSTVLVVAMYGKPVTNSGINLSLGNGNDNNNSGGDIMEAATHVGQTEDGESLWNRFIRGINDITPALIVTFVILGIAIAVAIFAHFKRWKLPPKLRESWYRHHAVYKISILIGLVIAAIMFCGGGAI